MQPTIKVKRLYPEAEKMPAYQTAGSSGADVCAALKEPLTLKPGERAMVPTGLAFEIPFGFEIQVRARSGLAAKNGIAVLNGPGTVDSDYRGELKVILANLGDKEFVIQPCDRIAQLVVSPVVQGLFETTAEINETVRGAGGFGSTGVSSEKR